MDTGEPAMDDPNTVGDVAGGKKKKKRNPSFRQHLRKMGLPLPPLAPQGRDPTLPPKVKRKRSYRRPNRHRTKKAKRLLAAAQGQAKTQIQGSAESFSLLHETDAKSDDKESDDCVDEDSGDDSDEDCDGWETDEDDSEEERAHQGEPLADDAKEIQVQEHQFQETLVEERQAEELQLQELQLQEHPLQEIQVEEHQAEENQVQEHQVQQYEEEDSEEEYLTYGRYDDPYPSYELQESYNHDYQPGEERPTRIPWHTSFRDYYAQRDQERRAREEATPTTDWNPADPLGLFDELEGPLDWSSQGLFD